MEQEKLNEIIADHNKWLKNEGGKRADLAGADLRGTDLHGANLRGANLYGASLYGADLHGANLRGADLYGASLRGANLFHANLFHADLRHANLCHANLRGADLAGANLPVGIYQIVGTGSCNRCTTYDVINDQIVCGCWNDGKGNHLDSFIKRIEEVYGPYEESYHPIYYTEYMAAVNFFKAMKELKENHDRQKGAIL